MLDLLSMTTASAVIALFAATWAMEGRNRNAAVALLGIAAFLASLVARLVASGSVLEALTGLLVDVGAAVLITAFYLRRIGKPSRAHLVLGLLALFLSWSINSLGGLAGWLWNPTVSQAPATEFTELLLELGPDDRIEEVGSVLDAYGATFERAFPGLTLADDEDLAQYYLVLVSAAAAPELIAALRDDEENVDSIEPNQRVGLVPPVTGDAEGARTATGLLANDPLATSQWWLSDIGGDAVHRRIVELEPDRKSVVAILDTGVDARHEDMAGSFGGQSGGSDENGHGTHCAGIAGAATNNGVGIASLNWDGRFLEIRSYAVLSGDGFGTAEAVAQGIIDATRDGADVISMSLGAWSPVPPRVEVDAVEFARSRNVVVVAAAGNASGDAGEHAPSNIEGVISVAAIDESGHRARFSNRNSSLSRPLSAPGVNILSLKPAGGYVSLNGTSMATPLVAGLAGLVRSLRPDLSPDEVYSVLRETSRPTRDDEQIGASIDAEATVERVLGSLPTYP